MLSYMHFPAFQFSVNLWMGFSSILKPKNHCDKGRELFGRGVIGILFWASGSIVGKPGLPLLYLECSTAYDFDFKAGPHFFWTSWSFLALSILLSYRPLSFSLPDRTGRQRYCWLIEKNVLLTKRESKMMSKAINSVGQTQKLCVKIPILVLVAYFLC